MKKWITPAQKIIAAILLAASFAMLFFPWIGVEREHTMEEYYEEYAEENDMSVREARKEILSELEEGFDEYRDEDTNLTGKDYVRLAKAEEDSAISPDELGFEVSVKYRMAKTWLDRYAEDSGSEWTKTARNLTDRLATAKVVLWIVMLLTGLSFVIALWTIHGSMRGGTIFNAVVWASLCVLALILVDKMNEPEFQEELGRYGTNFVGVTDDEPYHITNWPFVGAALSVLAYVSTYLPVGDKKKATHKPVVHTTVPVRAVGWTCSYCGTVCDNSYAFCTNCGTRRPAPRVCPSCGAKVPDGDVFCGRCGTRIPPAGL